MHRHFATEIALLFTFALVPTRTVAADIPLDDHANALKELMELYKLDLSKSYDLKGDPKIGYLAPCSTRPPRTRRRWKSSLRPSNSAFNSGRYSAWRTPGVRQTTAGPSS